jgi:nitroreductase
VGKVGAERPPREQIEQIIRAAGWAPNHYRTQPWRFVVVSGAARERLGDVMARSLARRLGDAESDEARQLIERERRKPLRAPVLIAVAAVPSDTPKAIEIEEIAATAAAVQNMLLAAQALGLGAMWRTGEPAYDPAVKQFLGLPEHAHILSFVYVGYPDMPPLPERERGDALAHATWLGWDEA